MTPFFNPGPNPYGAAEGVPRRGRREDDRGRGRGRRRHHRCTASPPSGTSREVTLPALERGWAKAGQGTRRRSRSSGPMFVVTGTTEEEIATAARRHEAADRVLRLDARVPRRARAARLGRPADRAQPAVEAGRVGGDGRAHRRRRCSTRSRSSASPRTIPKLMLGRYGDIARPHLVLRAVPVGPGALVAHPRRLPRRA